MEMLETRWTTGGNFLSLLSSTFLVEFSLPATFLSREGPSLSNMRPQLHLQLLSFPKDLLHTKIPWDCEDGVRLGSLGQGFVRVGKGSPSPCPLFWQGIETLRAAAVGALEPHHSFPCDQHLNLADKKAAFALCWQISTPANATACALFQRHFACYTWLPSGHLECSRGQSHTAPRAINLFKFAINESIK